MSLLFLVQYTEQTHTAAYSVSVCTYHEIYTIAVYMHVRMLVPAGQEPAYIRHAQQSCCRQVH